jgi:glyoxylase-like metal-dependent hydrolase (beta-lactamase superfamily II)
MNSAGILFKASVVLLIGMGALRAADQPAPKDPIVQPDSTTKLADHVYIIPDRSVPVVPNVGFVVGTKATLVIDTGLGPKNGATVVSEARKLSASNALYLVTTHVHPEHDLGAQAFPATTRMIRSTAQVQEIAEFGYQMADMFRQRSGAMQQLLEGAQFRKADITFPEHYSLDLGGVTAEIVAVGPNHTPGDTVVFIASDSVLFSGDVAMKGLPAFASPKSSLDHWLLALNRLDLFKPRVIVPSHGPTGDAAFIANYRSYLTQVRDRTIALKREGKTLDQTTQAITAELKDQFPDPGNRVGGAIKTAYTEAQASQ